MSSNAIRDLCEVIERLHAENPTMDRLAFTLPDVARVELIFTPSDGVVDEDGGANAPPG